MLQIGICDDARESRFQLRVLLERALEGRSAPARLLEFSSGDALLGWMDRHAGELDLVFLDIEMEGTNGMDTARALREADQSLQLVFVTGYSDYVFDGYEVAEAENGMQAVEMARAGGYGLIVMDIMMPELDGFSAAREIRKTSDVPIIFLSARGEEYDRIHGFELGVDDYVVKPFSPRELMMRVGAVLRRAQAPGSMENAHETVSIENMLVDFTARQVTIDGVEVELSPKEYDLLFFMVRNRGIALTRDRLISEVWGYDFFGDDRTLDTHIKLLRKQLGDYARYITTLRGVGYRFEKE